MTVNVDHDDHPHLQAGRLLPGQRRCHRSPLQNSQTTGATASSIDVYHAGQSPGQTVTRTAGTCSGGESNSGNQVTCIGASATVTYRFTYPTSGATRDVTFLSP